MQAACGGDEQAARELVTSQRNNRCNVVGLNRWTVKSSDCHKRCSTARTQPIGFGRTVNRSRRARRNVWSSVQWSVTAEFGLPRRIGDCKQAPPRPGQVHRKAVERVLFVPRLRRTDFQPVTSDLDRRTGSPSYLVPSGYQTEPRQRWPAGRGAAGWRERRLPGRQHQPDSTARGPAGEPAAPSVRT